MVFGLVLFGGFLLALVLISTGVVLMIKDSRAGRLANKPAKKAVELVTPGHLPPPPRVPPEWKRLSPVSRVLARQYAELPSDSRPFPDIYSILEGLDNLTSLDKADRNAHFLASGNRIDMEWGPCSHLPDFCKFFRYAEIYKQIDKVREAVKEAKQAELVSRFAGDAQAYDELLAGLREEAKVQRLMAKKMKSLS